MKQETQLDDPVKDSASIQKLMQESALIRKLDQEIGYTSSIVDETEQQLLKDGAYSGTLVK